MENTTKNNTESITKIYLSDTIISAGYNCQMCSEFQEGAIHVLMCKKCTEALREIILEKRGIKK